MTTAARTVATTTLGVAASVRHAMPTVAAVSTTKAISAAGERKAGKDVKHVRAECRRHGQKKQIEARQRPQRAEYEGCKSESIPQAKPGERKCGGSHDGDVNVERPVIRLLGCDQHWRQIRADDAETGECGSVQQGGCQSRQSHRSEKQEGGRGRKKFIERVGGIHCGIPNGRDRKST